eukprot:gb/GEZN01006137.1/.p1 GENE.gb/GEZN01006137.1/~~gb/GEZN01006137.1/.p1  ORF type:complete len:411 (-),score=71.63 gb/GEZN01006137.1/:177-1409(-)
MSDSDDEDLTVAERRKKKRIKNRAAKGVSKYQKERDDLLGDKELEAKAKDDRSNTEVLDSAIAHARAATELGAKTNEQLGRQTEQLKTVDSHLADMNQTMKRVEYILTNMEGFSGRLRNQAAGEFAKRPETRQTFKAETASSQAIKSQSSKKVPREFVTDVAQIELLKVKLETERKITFQTGEELLYFYYNSPRPRLDQTMVCISLTNLRLLRIDDGILRVDVPLSEVREVVKVKAATPFSYETLDLKLKDGFVQSVSIWHSEVANFLEHVISQVALANQDEENKYKTKKAEILARNRQKTADQSLQSHKEEIKEIQAKKTELMRIKNTENSKLSPEERQIKEQLMSEDSQLDTLNALLEETLAQAEDVEAELQLQKEMMGHIGTQIDQTNDRLGKAGGRADKITTVGFL